MPYIPEHPILSLPPKSIQVMPGKHGCFIRIAVLQCRYFCQLWPASGHASSSGCRDLRPSRPAGQYAAASKAGRKQRAGVVFHRNNHWWSRQEGGAKHDPWDFWGLCDIPRLHQDQSSIFCKEGSLSTKKVPRICGRHLSWLSCPTLCLFLS